MYNSMCVDKKIQKNSHFEKKEKRVARRLVDSMEDKK